VLVDDPVQYERICSFVERFMPRCLHLIELYRDEEPLFERYGVEVDITRALERKVWLKSGGYIVIDRTEALTAIDVNTGRYVGKTNLEDTIVKINLEAVKEIAYQIRLRNIGGIIVLDFIDMQLPENREKVCKALTEALKADKARTNVLKMSEIGLIEMTRKRVRESLVQRLTEPCFYCEGSGYLKAAALVAEEVLTRIRKVVAAPTFRIVHVTAHQRVAEQLWEERRESVVELEKRSGKTINIRAQDEFHLEQFEVFGK
jgi:ribonuclease G